MPDERSTFLDNYLNRRRLAYEKHGNFVAVLEAVPLTCPDWLTRAIYSIIATEIDEGVGLVGRWSVRHRRELVDFMRARAIALARAHGATWDEASEYAAEYFASTPAAAAGSSAMMKSWHRHTQRNRTQFEFALDLPQEFLPTKAIARAVWQSLQARLKKDGRWVDTPAAASRLRPRIDTSRKKNQSKGARRKS